MSDPKVALVIPFRDRGIDLRRAANLDVVQGWWYGHGFTPQIVDDGLSGDAQFNRHRAYNRAVSGNPDADVFVFTEADMLIHPNQINTAVELAMRALGLVVPFTQYRYLSDNMTEFVRNEYHDLSTQQLSMWWGASMWQPGSVFGLPPESTMDNGRSIGAVNVVSRETLEMTGGYSEVTYGNWYDDNIIEEGFAFLTGQKTRHVPGPAVHLYHLPGWKGDHLTDADRQATAHNKRVLDVLRFAIKTNNTARVRRIMSWREEQDR